MKKLIFALSLVFCLSASSNAQSIYCNYPFVEVDFPNISGTYVNNFEECNHFRKDYYPEMIYRLYIDIESGDENIHSLIRYSNTTELTIYGDLKYFPDEIFCLKKLKKLRLVHVNNLDWDLFFEKLSHIDHLEALEIHSCSFKYNRLPNSICLLNQLYALDIYGSFIDALPDSFNLRNLCYLRIKNTDLKNFPVNFKSNCLTTLEIRMNHFWGIPKEIENFKNLETLDFLGNIFHTEDTLVLSKNSELSHLYLDACGIEYFPIGLRGLPKLEYLTLACNKITVVPDELVDFKHLRRIELPLPQNNKQLISLFKKMPNCTISNSECRE